MPRSRNIKPSFFANDVLAECAYGARLVFVGLWCLADREGRLEDRPKRIKGQLLPYDNCDIDKWLKQLAEKGFITRYKIESRKFIQVNNFRKHQNPHVKEAASTIPAPCEQGARPADSLLLNADTGMPLTEGSSEPDKPTPEPVEGIEPFPCVGPEETWALTADKLAEWERTFPDLDVLAQCRLARQWLLDNPSRKKTHTGMPKYIGNWLSRTQNRGAASPSQKKLSDGDF